MLTLTSDAGVYWRSDDTVVIRGVEYYVTFERGTCEPCMKLSRSKLSGYIDGQLVRCGCSFAEFAFGDPYICTGTEGPGGPCSNAVTIRVEWTCCDREGWAGPGWYCARPVAKPGEAPVDCVALDLPDSARCDTSIELCSGPYVDEASAVAACGSAVPEVASLCCSDGPAAKRFRFMMNGITSTRAGCDAACAALNGVWQVLTLPDDPGFFCQWSGTAAFGAWCWVPGLNLYMRRTGSISIGGYVSFTITLEIQGFTVPPGGAPTYLVHDNNWDCKSPITLSLMYNTGDYTSGLMCDKFPDRITLYPF